jgi:FMN-dependent NADH-azoreductase
MHNFTVPAVLKAWLDHVLLPGRTFRSTGHGKVGLLADRPAFLIVACGGPGADDGEGQRDFLIPYFRYAMATIGLRNLSTLRLDRLRRGEIAVEHAYAKAATWIEEHAAVHTMNV